MGGDGEGESNDRDQRRARRGKQRSRRSLEVVHTDSLLVVEPLRFRASAVAHDPGVKTADLVRAQQVGDLSVHFPHGGLYRWPELLPHELNGFLISRQDGSDLRQLRPLG